jgi:predicted RNase H-like HicB family nuclease
MLVLGENMAKDDKNNLTELTLPVSIIKEGASFVAYTPALDISTFGETLGEAKSNFEQLVLVFFEELERNGNADEVLTSLGWRKIADQWSAPKEVQHTVETFRVPSPA